MSSGRGARLVLLSGPLWFATGCLSMGTVQTASTLGKGNFQISAEPGAYGLSLPNQPPAVGFSPEVVPHFDVAFRYGVNDRFDIGVRTGWSLIELQTKILFTDPDAEVLAISVAPTLGGTFGNSTSAGGAQTSITAFNFALPVLFGFKHFRANEFMFGPRINNMLFALRDNTGSAVVYLLGLGGTVGYSFAIGEIFRILPELGFTIPVVPSTQIGASAIANSGLGNVLWQLKVGLMFGRAGKRPPVPAPPPPEPEVAPGQPLYPEFEPAPAPAPEPAPEPAPPPTPEPVPAPEAPETPPPPPPAPDPVTPGP